MAKTKETPLDRLTALPPTRVVDWLSYLTPQQLKDLEEIRAAFRTGKLHHTKSAMYRWCKAEFGLQLSVHTFIRWLDPPK